MASLPLPYVGGAFMLAARRSIGDVFALDADPRRTGSAYDDFIAKMTLPIGRAIKPAVNVDSEAICAAKSLQCGKKSSGKTRVAAMP